MRCNKSFTSTVFLVEARYIPKRLGRLYIPTQLTLIKLTLKKIL